MLRRFTFRKAYGILLKQQHIFFVNHKVIRNPDHIAVMKIYRFFQAKPVQKNAVCAAVINQGKALFGAENGGMPSGNTLFPELQVFLSPDTNLGNFGKPEIPPPFRRRIRMGIDQNHIEFSRIILFPMNFQNIAV